MDVFFQKKHYSGSAQNRDEKSHAHSRTVILCILIVNFRVSMFALITSICVQWQLPLVKPGSVHVSEIALMKKSECVLLPFEHRYGVTMAIAKNVSFIVDIGMMGWSPQGSNRWYGDSGDAFGLYSLGNNQGRAFFCANEDTQIRVVGCYLGENGFSEIRPAMGDLFSAETLTAGQRFGFIITDTKEYTLFYVNTTEGLVKIRAIDRNGDVAEYSGTMTNQSASKGQLAFLDVEVIENWEGWLAVASQPYSEEKRVFQTVTPGNVVEDVALYAEKTIVTLAKQKSILEDAYIPIPLTLIFIIVFALAGIVTLVFLVFCPRPRVWLDDNTYLTLKGVKRESEKKQQ